MVKAQDPSLLERCSEHTSPDLRNSLQLAGLILLWAIGFAVASQMLKRDLPAAGPAYWAAFIVPLMLAAAVVWRFRRFLAESDELQRHIQLRALAAGYGGTFVVVTGHQMLERMGVVPAGDPADVLVVMAVCYSLASLIGWSRYR